MTNSKPVGSLSPTLLARKGGAKPAMRPQLLPTSALNVVAAHDIEDDLGWNDMGDSPDDLSDAAMQASALADHEAKILSINGGQILGFEKPEVVTRLDHLRREVSGQSAGRSTKERRSSLAEGRRAAFTLRIDADRHLRLRLASTITNRSAQQLITEALDKLLDEMPEVETLATKVRETR